MKFDWTSVLEFMGYLILLLGATLFCVILIRAIWETMHL